LTGSVNQIRDDIRYPDNDSLSTTTDRTTFQAGLTWRLLDFGGREANRMAANNLLTAALASHNAALQSALADVIQAYFDAMTTNAALKAATEGEEIAKSTLNSATVREEKGVVSQSDRLRATTALAKAVLEANRARGYYRRALAVLGQMMGVPGHTVISMPGEITANAGEIGNDLKQWLEEAQKNHPAILAAKAQVVAAQNQVDVARSAGWPTLNFSANYYQNSSLGQAVTQLESRETTIGVGLSLPIFDGFSNTYKIRGAQAQVEQKEAALADTENRIALELIKAYFDATYALQNLDASANLLKAAQEALFVSQRRYDKGAADITEILNTQSTLSEGQRERIRSIAEWHSARLRLLANAGQMGRSAATAENRDQTGQSIGKDGLPQKKPEVIVTQDTKPSGMNGTDLKKAELAKPAAENRDLTVPVAGKDGLPQKKSESIVEHDIAQSEMNGTDLKKAELAKPAEDAVGKSPAGDKTAGLKSIRIKVLSGTGKIDSADRMAKRLTAMGYKVESMEMADRSHYPANTVYFSQNQKKEAKTLASKLGKGTIAKPISWKSVFDLIVVAAR
jgi:outer membrane protein